jgi:NAD-specific glutamate dehydrogenase
LVVVEVRRDRDDGLLDLLAQERLGVALDLLQEERRELLGGVLLSVRSAIPVIRSHLPLEGGEGVLRVGNGLPPGRFADDQLAVLREGHIRGERLAAADGRSFRARYDDGASGFQDGRRRVARS